MKIYFEDGELVSSNYLPIKHYIVVNAASGMTSNINVLDNILENNPNKVHNHARQKTIIPWGLLTSNRVIRAQGVAVPAISNGIVEWSTILAIRFASPFFRLW